MGSMFGTLEGIITPFYDMKIIPFRKEIMTGTYYVSQVLRALWLVDVALHILNYKPLDFVMCFSAQFNFQEM